MAERKKQSLLTGAGVLAVATVIVKLIGAFYKIPLTNLIGAEGYGYFTGAYAVYTPLYSISMAGLPVAVAAMVSKSVELGRIKDAQLIFKISRKMFFIIGLVFTALMMALAVPYSQMVDREDNYISILVISPCVFFCCLMSAYRGYYEGLNNMTPTGVSQVVEATIKLTFGLAGAYIFMNKAMEYYRLNAVNGTLDFFGVTVTDEKTALSAIYPYSAAVAVLGVTLGSVFGCVYLAFMHKIKGDGFTRTEIVNSAAVRSKKEIGKELINIAFPVAVSSLILNLNTIIDDLTIGARLNYAMETGGDLIKNLYADALRLSGTLDEGISTYLYGVHGSVNNIRNLIPTITLTLGVSAIPVMAKAWALKNKKGIRLAVESTLRVTMIIAMPAGLGMAALSEPILELLYSSRAEMVPIAAPMLRTYGLAMFLFAAATPLTNLLQAAGNTKAPIVSIIIGGIAKFIYNYIMIARPEMNIQAVAGGSVACYAFMVGYNLFALLKTTDVKLDYISVFLKPFVSAIVCGGTALGSFILLTDKFALSSKLSCLISIAVGATFYALVLLILKGIVNDDVEMLPKGKKIAKVLAKFGLLG